MAINPKPSVTATQTLRDVRILIIDDEDILAWGIDTELKALGAETQRAGSLREALERFQSFSPDLVITDLRLPDGNGLELVKKWRLVAPDVPVILITAHGAIDSAVTALRLGAADYLQKPFDMKNLIAATQRVAEIAKLRQKVGRLTAPEAAAAEVTIIGETAAIQQLRDELRRIARSKATTALILGESGTGKELAARAIHEWSERRGQPFVEINCASIPETLLESELFGYEKGAFTDARERKLGLFEVARTGSVFLDEIGEMPLKLQAKLLRALEYRRFKRLGGTKDIEFTGRIIAATNLNLLEEATAKRFRADLYYRLSALPVRVPLLRDRLADVPVLTEFFLDKMAKDLGVHRPILAPEVVKVLMSHPWPGNVRELKNVLERALVFFEPEVLEPQHLRLDAVADPGSGRIDGGKAPHSAETSCDATLPRLDGCSTELAIAADRVVADPTVTSLPATIDERSAAALISPSRQSEAYRDVDPRPSASEFLLPEHGLNLEKVEKSFVLQALERAHQNQTRAAQLLGMSRHTLRYRMEKYGIPMPHAASL